VRGHGIVIASDAAATRLQRALDNVRRLARWPSPTVPLPLRFLVADARQPAIKSADVVLLDAPCTGTGTLRRHPDGKWRITSDDLRTLTQLQSDMLDAATSIVRVGGVLVYATCSLEPEENERVVGPFLAAQPEFRRDPPAEFPLPLESDGTLRCLPHRHGTDGFTAVRLRRA